MTLQFIYGMLVGCTVMAVTMFLASSVILNKAYRLGVSHGQQIIEIRQGIKKTQEIIGKVNCPACDGEGHISLSNNNYPISMIGESCPECGGTGYTSPTAKAPPLPTKPNFGLF